MKIRVKHVLITSLLIGSIFLIYDWFKPELYTIQEMTLFEDEYMLDVKSNKIINPSFRDATVNVTRAVLENENGEVLNLNDLEKGQALKIEFRSSVLLSDPPLVSALRIVLKN